MDDRLPDPNPDAKSVLHFVASLVWKSKWLIGAAVILAAVVAAILYKPEPKNVWSGRALLTIGLAPSIEYIVQLGGASLTPLETARAAIVRISDPTFRSKIADSAKFEQASAGLSKSMVVSSLRGVPTENEREITIELSAASDADVLAAFAAVTAEIQKAHGELMARRLQPLQNRLEEAKARIRQIEQATDSLNDRIFNAERGKMPLAFPSAAVASGFWNQLRDRILADSNLLALREPSVVQQLPRAAVSARGSGMIRGSIMAGLAMLIAMIVLTVVVNSRMRW